MSPMSGNLWCPRCAKPLPCDARFCRRCGQPLNAPPIRVPQGPRQAGWVKVATFGTASAWHAANGRLARHQITSRMMAETSSTQTDEQRMDLLVLASEAERARRILWPGTLEQAATASPSTGVTTRPEPVSTPVRGARISPHPAWRVTVLPPGQSPGNSSVNARNLVLLWFVLMATVIILVAILDG